MGMTASKTQSNKLPAGGAQSHMAFIVPRELEQRADDMWATHAEWMKKTHAKGGENACLFYHVCKGMEVETFIDGPKAKPTGNVVYTIVEFYANPAGLNQHFEMFHAGNWPGTAEFNKLMDTGKCKFHGHGYGQTLHSVAPDEFEVEQ